MLEVSDWAREILSRSQAAAHRFNPEARIRLTKTARGVEVVLTDAPGTADEVLDVDGVTLYVEPGLKGLLDVEEPHDRLVLRPAGSTPNPRS